MKLPLLALLALPYIAIGQSVGDIIIQKATISGATEVYVTPSPTKILGLNDSGEPSLISLGAGVTLPSGTLTISPAWSAITGTPTTLAGYGITDAQPLDTQLTALATLSGTVGTFPYFSSSNVISSGTITAAGRALIDDASAAVQRATLGLGSLATMSLTWLDETSDWTLWSHGIQLGTIKEVPPYVEILETGISFVSDTGGGTITPPTFTGGWAWQLPDKSGTFAFTGDITAALTAYAGSTSLDTLGVVNVGTWNADSIADGYIDSAVTWHNKQDGDTQLTSLSGLSYASNAGKFVRVNGGETGFELATVSGFVMGSLGSTDNAVPRADGAGGTTLQSSSMTIADNGNVLVNGAASFTTPMLAIGGPGTGFATIDGVTRIDLCMSGSQIVTFGAANSNYYTNLNVTSLGFDVFAGSQDISLLKGATGHLWQRAGSQAQIHSITNTYASPTSFEAWVVDWQTTANTCRVGTVKGSGGGTARQMIIQTDGTERIRITATGEIFMTLPTAAGTTGSLWNDGGTVKVAP